MNILYDVHYAIPPKYPPSPLSIIDRPRITYSIYDVLYQLYSRDAISALDSTRKVQYSMLCHSQYNLSRSAITMPLRVSRN